MIAVHGAPLTRALADDGVCDATLAPADGNWTVRWGAWSGDGPEPPYHVRCATSGASARLTTALLNASVLEWSGTIAPSRVREAEISFRVPALEDWSHVALFAAYDPTTIGRLGADVFHDTRDSGAPKDELLIQVNPTVDEGCAGGNLHAPVPIAGGIAADRWYRLRTRVAQRPNGSLVVSAVLRDLDAGNALVAATAYSAPASCTPSWFPAASRWGTGVLATRPGVETYLDDFAAFTATAGPQLVRVEEAFAADAVSGTFTVATDPGFSAATSAGELVLGGAAGAGPGEARIASAFQALGAFTVTVQARRSGLAGGDELGVRATLADSDVEIVLVPAGVLVLDAGVVVATAAEPAEVVTLRLARASGRIVAAIDGGTGFTPLAELAGGARGGRAGMALFVRRAGVDASASAGAFDDLTITAEQLAPTEVAPLDLVSYGSVWQPSAGSFIRFGAVELDDVLGPGDYDVRAPRALVPVAAVSAAAAAPPPAVDPPAFLVEYPLTTAQDAAKFRSRSVRLVDGCRDIPVRVTKPTSVLVPAEVAVPELPSGSPEADTSVGHFVCYQASAVAVSGAATTPKGLQAEVTDPVQARRYDLGHITKICNAADKLGDPVVRGGPHRGEPKPIVPSVVRDRGIHLVCRKAKPARRYIEQGICGPVTAGDRGTLIDPAQPAHARRQVAASTQFGPAPLATVRETEVCVAASLVTPD